MRNLHKIDDKLVSFGMLIVQDVLKEFLEGLPPFLGQFGIALDIDPELPEGSLRKLNEVLFELPRPQCTL